MKVCRKCSNEYKENYSFCPRCGTPHDLKTKYAKIPGEISNEVIDILLKIWNIILYVFGCVLILAYLLQFKNNVVSSIFAILFGLSLFQIFYKLIEENVSLISKKLLIVLRFSIPLILLIVWMICTPVDNSKVDDSSFSKDNTLNMETNKQESAEESQIGEYNLNYENAESFEKALNEGKKVNGNYVKFVVLEYKPDSALGINCWSGEHLNFISKKDFDVSKNDVIVGKITSEPTKVMGSWKIEYDVVKIDKLGSNDKEKVKKEITSTTQLTKLTKNVIKLTYNELGEYGKKQDYEGADDFFYYIPTGTYNVKRVSGSDKHCYLWIFYKKSYQDTWGTEYNSKEKFTYSSNGQTQTVTITDDVMVYNSNNCSYEFEKK